MCDFQNKFSETLEAIDLIIKHVVGWDADIAQKMAKIYGGFVLTQYSFFQWWHIWNMQVQCTIIIDMLLFNCVPNVLY